MLRARTTNGVFILGLDAENIRRLQAGQPIMISLAEMGGTDDVVIMASNTLEDIKHELEQAQGGRPLPEPQHLNVTRKPQ